MLNNCNSCKGYHTMVVMIDKSVKNLIICLQDMGNFLLRVYLGSGVIEYMMKDGYLKGKMEYQMEYIHLSML